MAQKVYQLYKEHIGGVDWHDKYVVEQPICEMSEVDVEKFKEIIFHDILTSYPGIDENVVKEVLNGTIEKYCFVEEMQNGKETGHFLTLEDTQKSCEYWEIRLLEKKSTTIFQEVLVTFLSQFQYDVVYWVEEINNPKYFVIETLGAPYKGCMEVRKILAGPFDTREMANVAKTTVTKHEYEEVQDVDVFGIDILAPTAQKWLKYANEIFELEQRFENIEERNKFFIADNKSHLNNLRAHFGILSKD